MPQTSLTVEPQVSGISFHRQMQPAGCLAACVAMVLNYLGQSLPYARLLALLDIAMHTT